MIFFDTYEVARAQKSQWLKYISSFKWLKSVPGSKVKYIVYVLLENSVI